MRHNTMGSRQFFTKYGTILAFAALFAAFAIGVRGFADPGNLMNILTQIALLLIIAEGFTMVLIVGELDLSFANLASLASVLVAGLIMRGMHPALAVALCLAGGVAFGLVNGLLVTKVGIASLITTLAMGIIANGFIYMYTKGVSFYGNLPDGFLFLGRGMIGPIPVLVLIMFAVLAASHVFVKDTVAGSSLQATGGNAQAARIAGIDTQFYKILGLSICSFAAALTGVLLTSRLGAANPEGAGGFLMEGFAIVLLGQTAFTVGRANPLGTFVGALIIGTLNNGLTLLGADYFMQDIVKGLIILLAVVISSLQTKKLEGRA
jgi:ribose/xylose/arabinose/galactoside ABC-type transport system permease subunit